MLLVRRRQSVGTSLINHFSTLSARSTFNSGKLEFLPFSAEMPHKQWSMVAALQDVQGGMGVREAARLYNLPYETLRRRVVEKVGLDCRPGPPTVLMEHEEGELASYCVKMADMGFGLSLMGVAYKIAESSGREHPFKVAQKDMFASLIARAFF